MNFYDLVRKHFPNATDDECEYILWEKTPFPMVTSRIIEAYIIDFAKRSKLL
jgi:hypothetical protein